MSKLKTEDVSKDRERKPIIRNKNAYYALYMIQGDGSFIQLARFSTPEQLCEEYKKEIEKHPDKEYRERLVMKKEAVLKPQITERKMTVRL